MIGSSANNKYRAAIEVLQRGREALVETLAEEVLSQEDDLLEGGFLFNEFLEAQGTRLHFLSLLVSHLEQSADSLDEAYAEPVVPLPQPKAQPRKRKPRAKKLPQQATTERKPED
jgi:3-phosphoglycerate kinase